MACEFVLVGWSRYGVLYACRRSQQALIVRRSSQRAARSVNCTRAEGWLSLMHAASVTSHCEGCYSLVPCCAAWNPPTVSDTKRAFYESFKKPIPPIYNTVILELLVQQHLLRWNFTYQYDEVNVCKFTWLAQLLACTARQTCNLSALQMSCTHCSMAAVTGVCTWLCERV